MAKIEQPPMLRFGDFVLSPRERSLYKHGVRLKLHGQPFEILLLLLGRPGEAVTREELQAKLWSDNTFVDFEHGLNTAIKKLRQTLGDSADVPRFIETVPRVGYRFIAPVSSGVAPVTEIGPGLQIASEKPSGKNPPYSPVTPVRSFRQWPALVTSSMLMILLVSVYFALRRPKPRPQPTRIMLAVLPFDNLTGDASQDYFSDGLTEEMISQLGRLDPQHIGVIARTSIMSYKHRSESLGKVGHELGVEYVLEGSVRRDSQDVRISAQLIQVRDQTHVWARQYDRQLSSLLVLQSEIAQEIADEIQLTLDEAHTRVPAGPRIDTSPPSYQAYDLYLKGLYSWNKRTIPGFRQAIEYFQQSIAEDPNYARAYAGLANSYSMMCSYNAAPANEFMPKARSAALKALQIDDGLAEAHTSLAIVAENYDWDWQTAEKEYRRAIQLDPAYATAHQWYAESLSFQGRFDEAFAESEQARRLDPLSLIVAVDHGAILYFSRQYDLAIKQLQSVLEMNANFPRAYILIYVYVQEERFADALKAMKQDPGIINTPWTPAIEAYIYGRSGQKALAQRALTQLQRAGRDPKPDTTPMLLMAYSGMNKKDEAIACLQQALSEHSNVLTTLKVDPIYDPLRTDPRFKAILRRAGLAP